MSTLTDDALVDLLGETRARVVELVHGAARTVTELATALDLSDVAVRRHVRELVEAGLLEGRRERPSGRGRPSTRYTLAERGQRLFPDRSATLAHELLDFLAADDDGSELVEFLAWRRGRQRVRYGDALTGASGVEARARRLAEQLTADGYQAGVARTTNAHGRPVLELRQEHCAIRQLAAEHPQLCGAEKELFADLLDTPIERTQTQADGASSCVCEIALDEPGAALDEPAAAPRGATAGSELTDAGSSPHDRRRAQGPKPARPTDVQER